MSYVSDLTVTRAARTLSLGDQTVTVEGYRLQAERPCRLTAMWDGSWERQMMGQKPCTLTISAKYVTGDDTAFLQTLRTELTGNTARAFSLDGMTFTDMRLTDYTVAVAPGERYAAVTLTMVGTRAGEENA